MQNSNNIETLRAKLFETIDALNSGAVSVEQARAVAELAGVIISSAKVEVDFLKVVTDPGNRNALGSGFIPGNVGRLAIQAKDTDQPNQNTTLTSTS